MNKDENPNEFKPLEDQRRHELLQAGLDMLDQGLTLFDENLCLVAWNEPMMHLLDFPSELVYVGAPFESFMRYNAERGEYGPGDVDALVAERVNAARTFRPHYTERGRPSGQIIAARGEPLPHNGFITLYTDITAQRHYEQLIREQNAELEKRVQERTAELQAINERLLAASEANNLITAALRRSEERLRLITDTVPALIGYFDKHHVYRYANKGYADWFGLSKDKIVGAPIPDVISEKIYNSIRHHVDKAIEGHRVTYEYSIEKEDGRTMYARSALVPEVGPDGTVLGCFVLSVNITELKHAQAALVQAQKMEAVGQLTGGLAHDFNNLLTVVIGNLAALKDRATDPAEVSEFIDPALKAARHGADIIKRLLTFARQQPLEPKPVEVSQVLQESVALLQRSLPSHVKLETILPSSPLQAFTDANQLENAVLNLAINARDAMPDGGHITISSQAIAVTEDNAEEYEVKPGKYVEIAVADNGNGMSEQTLARAFEPFYTTKKFGSGSGLGLSMVYGFAKQSGGSVRIRSVLGQGTRISLLLPRPHPGQKQARNKGAVESKITPIEKPLVLLVDDDHDVRKTIRMHLMALDYPVIEAENASEALTMLKHISDIGILMSDVVMPGTMNGYDLCAAAQKIHPDMRILLMSGYTEILHQLQETENNFAVLAKPFTQQALSDALSATLIQEGKPS